MLCDNCLPQLERETTSAKDDSFEMQITFHDIRKEHTITSSEMRAVLCSICPDFFVGGQGGEGGKAREGV